MRDLTVGVFGHLDIMYVRYADLRIKYTECILRGRVLKKYQLVLVECKDPTK